VLRETPASTATPSALFDQLIDAIALRLLERLDDYGVRISERSDVNETTKPSLLDRTGLAKALGVSTATVRRLRRDGCPAIKVGDMDRFEKDAVIAWLRARRPQ
jgi:hypothetical protein